MRLVSEEIRREQAKIVPTFYSEFSVWANKLIRHVENGLYDKRSESQM